MEDLFTQPATVPFQAHSGTSRAAAEAIKPVAATFKARVLAAIRAKGEVGMTDDEGCTALGMLQNTYRPRRIDCVKDGTIRDSGTKRPTSGGSPAVVWVAV